MDGPVTQERRLRRLIPLVGHAVDDSVAVIAEQQGAVLREGNLDGASPDILMIGDEADHKILVLAGGFAIFEGEADDLVAGPQGAIPRAVQGNEGIAFPACGELTALVEGKPERCGVRLEQHVRDCDLAFEVGTRATTWPFVLVVADVVPGPAVEGSRLDRGHVIRRQVIAEQIAFVGGAEHRAGSGLDPKPRIGYEAGGAGSEEGQWPSTLSQQ